MPQQHIDPCPLNPDSCLLRLRYHVLMSEALDIIREGTRGTEYEGALFLVGGVLRDRALGLPAPEDVDLVLEGDAVRHRCVVKSGTHPSVRFAG